MLDPDAIEARAEAALDAAEILVCAYQLHGRADPTIYDSQCPGRVCVIKGIVRTMQPNISALVAELRAAREVVEADTAQAMKVGLVAALNHPYMSCNEPELFPDESQRCFTCQGLAATLRHEAALAAYRAVVGEA